MTDTPEMVERVARAIWDARENRLPEDSRIPFARRDSDEPFIMARAAITAMREPTEAMGQAGYERGVWGADTIGKIEGWEESNPENAWRAMIDAALGEKP